MVKQDKKALSVRKRAQKLQVSLICKKYGVDPLKYYNYSPEALIHAIKLDIRNNKFYAYAS